MRVDAMRNVHARLARRGDTLIAVTAIEASIAAVSDVAGLHADAVRHAPAAQDVTHKKPDAVARTTARRHAIYCAATLFGCSHRAIARGLGIKRQLVDRFVGQVEEAREQTSVDRMIDEVELALMGAG